MMYSWRLMMTLWWIGIAGLACAGIYVIAVCGVHIASKRKGMQSPRYAPGRLYSLRQVLLQAHTGNYSRQQLHRIFSGIAVELLRTEINLSEEAAWQRVRQGKWQGGDLLNAYLEDPSPSACAGWRSRFRLARPAKDALFLSRTHELIDMLHEYLKSGATGKMS